jgi:dihydrolipoamide dehydrogenase
VAILGGGPVGIELGQMFQRYGTRTTVIEAEDRLLAREDAAVGELVVAGLREEGIDVRVGTRAIDVSASRGRRTVRLDSGDEVSAQELVVATGRRPRVEGIGLETVGIEPKKGGVEVDERCRAGDGVWAVGDVTGIMPFTHVAKYQARVACADILGNEVPADYRAIPRVVFADPEIAAVGLTEQQATEKSISLATSRISLREVISRPWTYEENPRGELALLADRERRLLVGAWAVAPLASEWIHHAALAIKAKIPIEVLRDTVAQFPTFSEAYLKAVERFDL